MSEDEFVKRVQTGQFRKPREINPLIAPALEAICLKAMALRPEDRYQTAGALADDLERWRAGQPVEPYPEPRLDRLTRWSRKHRTRLVASAVLLVSTTVGLAVLAIQEYRKNQRINEAMAITQKANDETQHALLVANDARKTSDEDRAATLEDLKHSRMTLRRLMQGLSGADLGYLQNSGEPRFALSQNVLNLYKDLIAKHPQDTDVQYELALASKATADIGRSIGQFVVTETFYQQTVDLLDRLLADHPGSDDQRILLAETLVEQGENARASGRIKDAEPFHRRALKVLSERPGSNPEVEHRYRQAEAIAWMDLAGAFYESNRSAEAWPMIEKSVQRLKPLADPLDAPWLSRIYQIKAVLLQADISFELGRLDEARPLFEEAGRLAQVCREKPEFDNPDSRLTEAGVHAHQARLFTAQNQHADALKAYEAAQALIWEVYWSSFRPFYIEQELAECWVGRASARLDLLAERPEPNQLSPIAADLLKAQKVIVQLVERSPDYYAHHLLHGKNRLALARLSQIKNQPEEARGHLVQAVDSFRLTYQCHDDDQESRQLEAKARQELDRLQAGGP